MKKKKTLCLLFGQISLVAGSFTFGFTIEDMSVIQYIAMISVMTGGYLFAKSQ